MRAVVVYGAQDVRIDDVDRTSPSDGEVEVAVSVGGICGSDLHYFHRGGVGDFAIREPLILGHEVAGVIATVGPSVGGLAPGMRVAIDPSRPCGVCQHCADNAPNLCTDMRFLGSAATLPHTQGGFRDSFVVSASQCVPVPEGLALTAAVLAEPLAVAMHAVGRAGSLAGKRGLIVGSGPIGVLVTVAAVRAGAASVVVTDVLDPPLRIAEEFGASHTINVGMGRADVPAVDVAFECSGTQAGLSSAVAALVPGGQLVLVGLLPPGDIRIAGNRAVTEELILTGSFRFRRAEFAAALDALARGLDLSPLVTSRFLLGEAEHALRAASDRSQSMKVQLLIGDTD